MVKEYHLSDKCLLLCTCAESTLTDVYNRISNGSVKSIELSLIKKKKNHVLKLICAAIKDEDVAKRLEAATSEKGLKLRKSEMKVGKVLEQCEDAERIAREYEEQVGQSGLVKSVPLICKQK